MEYREFSENTLVQDGVIRNLMVIGEATKLIPEPLKCEYADIPWRKIAGIRDILVPAYFGVHMGIVWDVIRNKIPDLQVAIRQMLEQQPGQYFFSRPSISPPHHGEVPFRTTHFQEMASPDMPGQNFITYIVP